MQLTAGEDIKRGDPVRIDLNGKVYITSPLKESFYFTYPSKENEGE